MNARTSTLESEGRVGNRRHRSDLVARLMKSPGVVAMILASTLSCEERTRSAKNQVEQPQGSKEPVTLVFGGSDTLGARLLPQLAMEYKKENSHVSFEIAAEGGRPSLSSTARFLSSGGILMTNRRIRDDERHRLEAQLLELERIEDAEQGRRTVEGTVERPAH